MPNISIEQMVRREVVCCLSHLISTIAQGYVTPQRGPGTRNIESQMQAMEDLHTQAAELCYPRQDYEEAATQSGWTGPHKDKFGGNYYELVEDGERVTWACGSWEALCSEFEIDAYEWEVFEHWAVSEWLANKLEAAGERIDHDFAGMHVWGRTCSGQGISSDGVIERIYADMIAA